MSIRCSSRSTQSPRRRASSRKSSSAPSQDALEAAARKRYKTEELRARFNTETGQLELYAVKKIVD